MLKRRIGVLFAALLLALSQEPTLTIRLAPTPMPQALELLSKASGTKLEASAAFRDEVLLARLNHAPVKATLAQLADAMDGSWEKRADGSLRLVRDPLKERATAQRDQAEVMKTAINSFAYTRRRLAQQPAELSKADAERYRKAKELDDRQRKAAEVGQDYKRMFVETTTQEMTAGWRACARLADLVGGPSLAQLPNDAREVWAEQPTAMQHAFPAPATPILDRYRREIDLFYPDAQISRVKLVIQRWESGGAMSAYLVALGADGKAIESTTVRLADDSEVLQKLGGHTWVPEPKPGEKPIEVPQDIAELRMAVGQNESVVRRQMFLRWRLSLLDPVHYEPTQYGTSVELLATADAYDANLIGTVDDSGPFIYPVGQPKTPSQFLAKAGPSLEVGKDGWWISRIGPERQRVPRQWGGQFINRCAGISGVPLDDASVYALTVPGHYPFSNWMGHYLMAFLPSNGPFGISSIVYGARAVRLWGAMKPAWPDLRKGETVSIRSLSREAREQLFQLVFWQRLLETPGDPTELLPNGIVAGTVQLKVAETPLFIGFNSDKGETGWENPLNTAKFGQALAIGIKDWQADASVFRAQNRFRMGLDRSYSLTFTYQPGGLQSVLDLSETFLDRTSTPLERLPAPLAEEVEKARQEALSKPTNREVGGQ